jgi:hypothetical protein
MSKQSVVLDKESVMNRWRWQDYLSLLIGLWIASSPWLLGFADTHVAATWNAVLVGLAVALLAAFDLEFLSKAEEWVLVALGAWVAVSPWLLGPSGVAAVTSMVGSGVAIVVLTLWEIEAAAGWRHLRRHAHS